MLPTSLQPVKEASKNVQRVKVQLVKADAVCTDTLNRTPRNVQSSKTQPFVTTSDRSHSTNVSWE